MAYSPSSAPGVWQYKTQNNRANMPCFHPVTGYRSRLGRNANGSWPIVFNTREGYYDLPVIIPCGGCIGCRLEKSRQWAIRIMFEAGQYENNSFITLTFNDSNLPEQLKKSDLQLFQKRVRKLCASRYEKQVRFFSCGEYGEQNKRPHYHVCLFNHDFPDREPLTPTLFRSNELESLWPFGFSSFGQLTFESAAYVARYVTKKITGDMQDEHYQGKQPEFALMSRRPGIGRQWYDEYKNDLFVADRVIVKKSLQSAIPRYYNNLMRTDDPTRYEQILQKRKEHHNEVDHDFRRLIVKEKIQNLKAKKLKRSFENG